MEEFKWRYQVQDSTSGNVKRNQKNIQFGDGYEQVSGVGLNDKSEEWGVSLTVRKGDMRDIKDFLDRNANKSFAWVNPLGDKILVRVVADSESYTPLGGNVFKVAATFKIAFFAEE